ncbi:TMEM165/GDT1 family protein [Parvibaculum sp. MBR-TMA-1.3b-4.2]
MYLPGRSFEMDAFLISTVTVAIAEIGDKTQLLALILALRFRQPWPVVWGILAATLANHALAAWAGVELAGFMDRELMTRLVGVSFILMGFWALIPDKAPEDDATELERTKRFGPFLATVIAFFLVEIGDKTQIATAALAVRFDSVLHVAAGTTLGMMFANVPVVFFGEKVARFVPLGWVRATAAFIFIALGAVTLLSAFGYL